LRKRSKASQPGRQRQKKRNKVRNKHNNIRPEADDEMLPIEIKSKDLDLKDYRLEMLSVERRRDTASAVYLSLFAIVAITALISEVPLVHTVVTELLLAWKLSRLT
jgi:hypothetical protein